MAYPRSLRSRSFKFVTRTAGDLTLDFTDSTWRAVNGTAFDITLPAQVGDTFALAFGVRCNGGNNTGFDIMTIVSSSVVSCASGVAYSTSANAGIGALFHPSGSSNSHQCYVPYTVVAGDITTATLSVTFRPMFRNVSGIGANSACIVYASGSGGVPFFQAHNMGPISPH